MNRRAFIGAGCAALLLASLPAEAARDPRPAPRLRCPHAGCRHHRPARGGTCAFALRGGAAVLPDEPLPTEAIPEEAP